MPNATKLIFALLCASAAVLFFIARGEEATHVPALQMPSPSAPSLVRVNGTRFLVGEQPVRFVSANVAVIYGATEREQMPATLRSVRVHGVSVVRLWAHGEWDAASPARAPNDWLAGGAFRRSRDEWNEAAFVHLDRTLAEAARQGLRVQLCLANWWRDTGGVAQYLAWAGDTNAADASQAFGINISAAMRFYTNEETRRLYREHVRRIVTRRNTITGVLYRDDPTIFAYELINEAQSIAGREAERRAWVDEMSRYLKSIDAHHLVTPGVWGYRTARERREWIADHSLPGIDFCDVHLYPRDDTDSFAATLPAMRSFIENRVAAALTVGKPLVFGEWGMVREGFAGISQTDWFAAYFDAAAHIGANGASFWIVTPDETREYGITPAAARDRDVWQAIQHGAQLFDNLKDLRPPPRLYDSHAYLVPHTTTLAASNLQGVLAASAVPNMTIEASGTQIFRFTPTQLTGAEFERLDGGEAYAWGAGVGFFEYVVPARNSWHTVSEIIVRAHLQPVIPQDAAGNIKQSRVKLFVNNADCGAQLVSLSNERAVSTAEWHITDSKTRTAAARGRLLTLRFTVMPNADLPFGINISNSPARDAARNRAPIEVEIR